jgi:predicted nucleotidyltransferase
VNRPDPDWLVPLASALAAEPDIELAYLFGSHASGRTRPESDIDIGVLVSARAASNPRETLAQLLGRIGRVIASNRLDLVLLNGASSLLRHRIVSIGRLLLARSPAIRHRFVTRAIQDYQDMQIRREFFYGKRVASIREGRPDGGSRDLLAQARRVARLFGQAPSVSRHG